MEPFYCIRHVLVHVLRALPPSLQTLPEPRPRELLRRLHAGVPRGRHARGRARRLALGGRGARARARRGARERLAAARSTRAALLPGAHLRRDRLQHGAVRLLRIRHTTRVLTSSTKSNVTSTVNYIVLKQQVDAKLCPQLRRCSLWQ